eukprot:SAG11_NODE_789_length_7139_cov_5.205607_8_plen_132_part_00
MYDDAQLIYLRLHADGTYDIVDEHADRERGSDDREATDEVPVLPLVPLPLPMFASASELAEWRRVLSFSATKSLSRSSSISFMMVSRQPSIMLNWCATTAGICPSSSVPESLNQPEKGLFTKNNRCQSFAL